MHSDRRADLFRYRESRANGCLPIGDAPMIGKAITASSGDVGTCVTDGSWVRFLGLGRGSRPKARLVVGLVRAPCLIAAGGRFFGAWSCPLKRWHLKFAAFPGVRQSAWRGAWRAFPRGLPILRCPCGYIGFDGTLRRAPPLSTVLPGTFRAAKIGVISGLGGFGFLS